MKRILGLLLAVLMMAGAVYAQTGACYTRRAEQSIAWYIAPIPNATVRVCTTPSTGTPCTPLMTLYSDYTLGQKIQNPLVADETGVYTFCVPIPAIVDIQISSPTTLPYTIPAVAIGGSGGGSGSGSVTSFSAGYLNPIFTTNVATPQTTPSLSFVLSSVASYSVLANCTSTTATPTYCHLNASMIAIAGLLSNDTTGNSGTTTKFQNPPTSCPTGQASTGVDSFGNALGCFTPSSISAHNLLSTTHTDTVPDAASAGDLIAGNSSGFWQKVLGNNTTMKLCLMEQGDGTHAARPTWGNCATANVMQQFTPPRTDMAMVVLQPTAVTTWFDTGETYLSSPLVAGGATPDGSGWLTRMASCALCDGNSYAYWSGYQLPASISPASIQHVYAVTSSGRYFTPGNGAGVASISCGTGTISYAIGPSWTGSMWAVAGAGGTGIPWQLQQYSQELTPVSSIANSINSLSCAMSNVSSSYYTGATDTTTVDYMYLVVYYTGTYNYSNSNVQTVPPLSFNESLSTLSLDPFGYVPSVNGVPGPLTITGGGVSCTNTFPQTCTVSTGGGSYTLPPSSPSNLGGVYDKDCSAVGSNYVIQKLSGGTYSCVAVTTGSGMSNPMTTQYDTIIGGTGGNPQRLVASTASGDAVLTATGNGSSTTALQYKQAPTISAANMVNFPTFNQSTTGNAATATTAASATNVAGGALGSISYQSGVGVTAMLAGNTAATDQVLVSHGTGSAAQAPTLSNAPALSAANMSSFPTFNQSTTGNAATATQLASTPTKCNAGYYPLGVDKGGNALGCTQAAASGMTNPFTTVGDTVYSADSSGNPARLAGNTTTQIAVLTSVGTGSAAQVPSWTLASGTGQAVFNTSPNLQTPTIAYDSGHQSLCFKGSGTNNSQCLNWGGNSVANPLILYLPRMAALDATATDSLVGAYAPATLSQKTFDTASNTFLIAGVPLCTGYAPTASGQSFTYTTGGTPSPCYAPVPPPCPSDGSGGITCTGQGTFPGGITVGTGPVSVTTLAARSANLHDEVALYDSGDCSTQNTSKATTCMCLAVSSGLCTLWASEGGGSQTYLFAPQSFTWTIGGSVVTGSTTQTLPITLTGSCPNGSIMECGVGTIGSMTPIANCSNITVSSAGNYTGRCGGQDFTPGAFNTVNISGGTSNTFAYVQGCAGSTCPYASSATVSHTLTSSITSGNVLTAVSKTESTSTPTVTFTSTGPCNGHWVVANPIASQTVGTSWTNAASATCNIPSTGAETVTVTWTGGGVGTYTDITVGEYSASAGWKSPVLDVQSSQVNSTASTSAPSSAITTTNAHDLVLNFVETYNSAETWASVPTGFVLRSASSRNTVGWFDQFATGTGTFNPTTTLQNSDTSVVLTLALKAN